MHQHRVFLSYRRDSGSEVARIFAAELRAFGIEVFLDVDSLRNGYFDDQLLRELEARESFIVILSPYCFDIPDTESDWFFREIEHAIATQRSIVPVLARGFVMPRASELPSTMQALFRYQSITYSHEYHAASIQKLIGYIRGATVSVTMSGREPVLVVTGLEKTLPGGRQLFSGISLVIGRGELILFTGPSGSGITSIMKAISGESATDAGGVELFGARPLTSQAFIGKKVALVDDRTHMQFIRSLWAHGRRLSVIRSLLVATARPTVGQLLRIVAQIYTPNDDIERLERVQSALELTDLKKYEEKLARNLDHSGGERLKIALSLLSNPAIIIYDPPISANHRTWLQLRKIASFGIAVLAVDRSHDATEKCGLCGIIAGGRLAYFGPTAECAPHFGVSRFPAVFEALNMLSHSEWADRFKSSYLFQQYCIASNDE